MFTAINYINMLLDASYVYNKVETNQNAYETKQRINRNGLYTSRTFLLGNQAVEHDELTKLLTS